MNTRIPGGSATRREFLGSARPPSRPRDDAAQPRSELMPAKPNSVFNGVRIGCITYSYRGGINSAEDTLKALIQDGLSEVELMGGPIQSYAGLAAARGRKGSGEQPAKPTDAQRQAQLAKCQELRKMYNDAGVNIHIHKIGFGQSDEEIDFNFQVAKALGCVGITTERSEALAKKLAPFADKHKIWVAFHNHTNNYPVMDKTDPILAYGQYIGFNFDVGHYFAGTKGLSPIPGDREVPRPHRQPASEGPDRRRREPALGPGEDAAQGNSPVDEEGEVDVPGRHRAGISRFRKARTRWRKWPSASSTARRRSPDRRCRCSGLCRDEVQAACGGQVECIADQRRTRVEGRVHLDLRQHFLPPSRTKHGHAAVHVAHVQPVAGQQQAPPDGRVRFVFPDDGARCRRPDSETVPPRSPTYSNPSFTMGVATTRPTSRHVQRRLLSVTSPWPFGLIACSSEGPLPCEGSCPMARKTRPSS